MRIAIIGAGFTGLSAAYQLIGKGHEVFVIEKDKHPGGLAIGYQEPGWDWSLEYHYHHWFTNDDYILNLAREINYPVVIRRPKTSVYVDKEIFQLDSPLSVLKFPKLTLLQRLRMSTVLALLKYNPYWKPLERIHASTFLPQAMGVKAYEMLWQPLLHNKFGRYQDTISLAWFWARIYKRTPSLAYPQKGFLPFAKAVAKVIEQKGAKIFFETQITELIPQQNGITLVANGKKLTNKSFDRVIVTLPSQFFLRIAPSLPDTYKNALSKLNSLGAINMVLRLSKPFFKDNTYWLSVCDKKSPIMAIVEHTNFMDKHHYNNEHIVYLGNYLPREHAFFSLSEKELLTKYDQYLLQINPTYKKDLIGMRVFKAPFAQPVIPVSYSRIMPAFTTPIPHVYLANIDQVYPWDRGTNYAVELGAENCPAYLT